MSRELNTQLFLDVRVEYNVLPAENNLPMQIDITGVFTSVQEGSDRKRRANILHALNESALVNLEEEIEKEVLYAQQSF